MASSAPSAWLQGGETRHQALQRSLAERDSGGPNEQIRSKPYRLQGTRSCEISHSSLLEPLTPWKSLESSKPKWPHAFRRFHLTEGIRVVDNDTIVVSARDQVQKTAKNGLIRSSSGSATYSQAQRQKAEIEVQELAHILADGPPGGAFAWSPQKLEAIFKERTGRVGVWSHYDLGIRAFILCFPKTFEMYGQNHEYVRLRRARNTIVLDHSEDAMLRLARARTHGFIQQHATVPGAVAGVHLELPSLRTNRLKVAFLPYDEPASHTPTFRDY